MDESPKLFSVLGRLLLSLPMLIYPFFHFRFGPGVATLVPPWIPWHLFWTYFTAVTIFAAGVAILMNRHARLPAILLGTEILLFVALIHVFVLWQRPGDAWAAHPRFGDLPGRLNNAFKDFGLSGAVFIFAGTQAKALRAAGEDKFLTLGRIIVGVSITAFGVLHFIYPAFAPGIQPMFTTISFVLPGHVFWVYLTAATFLVCGVGILLNWQTRWCASVAGMVILVFDLLTWGPRFFAHPGELAGNWLKDLGIAGGALILAGYWMVRRDAGRVRAEAEVGKTAVTIS
jgi:uncharacterized membrane protein YphA (DoxX/SURF4 family)